MARRKEPWSYTAGERPYQVTVYERVAGGPISVRIWDPTLRGGKGQMVRRSLKHNDREKAREYAGDQASKLVKGQAEIGAGRVTLADIFAAYGQYRTPRKSASEQQADWRCVEMWTRVLGGDRDPHDISLREWESFTDRRASGEINARGRVANHCRPVRPRAVQSDCEWLGWVFNWAVKWRTERGYLMRENPVRGFERPREENPRRPVASSDRFDKVRAVSDLVQMDIRWQQGNRGRTRSYLSEILEIVHGTGRRISAVCGLTFGDLRLTEGPHGSIRWPADTDKMGMESVVPISPRVRTALDRIGRERPGIGAVPLFPSPVYRHESIRYELASAWLRQAEKLANLEKQDGSLWHAYRRGWATSRKHLPDADVANAGGWKSTETLRRVYQQPDADTMLRVVLEATELREAK